MIQANTILDVGYDSQSRSSRLSPERWRHVPDGVPRLPEQVWCRPFTGNWYRAINSFVKPFPNNGVVRKSSILQSQHDHSRDQSA